MNTIEIDNKESIETLNSMIRGERSAVETYDRAIEKFDGDACIPKLREIRDSHVKAVGYLERNVRALGGKPDDGSGAWGTFANLVQAAANLFGDSSAVASLSAGEEHGRKDYQDILGTGEISPECQNLIRNKLLPNIEANLSTLKAVQENS